MADYREISQEYAQGSIKAAILINGGASVAVLSQLSGLREFMDHGAISCGLLAFAAGVVLGAVTWLLAFSSTRFVDQKDRGQISSYFKADVAMYLAILSVLSSLACFSYGCWVLAGSITSQ
ncbi:hypothetical protein [uncultured Ruegeria sp.]|uniref:hypothetical protein n=1 Tax=uncultured Ruegeria sp. TaxID=259304 RepID=UPI00262DDCA1|nr:hypothetical protein [uncultured Ruegeria sp.]